MKKTYIQPTTLTRKVVISNMIMGSRDGQSVGLSSSSADAGTTSEGTLSSQDAKSSWGVDFGE